MHLKVRFDDDPPAARVDRVGADRGRLFSKRLFVVAVAADFAHAYAFGMSGAPPPMQCEE